MTTKIKSRKGLLKVYKSRSQDVRDFFEHLPRLLDHFPLDLSLAYMFARLELGQNQTLYCGVVKVYRADRLSSSLLPFIANNLPIPDATEKSVAVFS